MIRFQNIILTPFIFTFLLLLACKNKTEEKSFAEISDATAIENDIPKKKELSETFKKYWYNSEAEITTYELEQARYGEIRKGKAVLIYVTEDFLPKIQVKADQINKKNIPILKLNATKNFVTGIYPYSIMQSTFYPVSNDRHALKVSGSVQEWCGQMYTQINNRAQYDIVSHSYFQGEADQRFRIEKDILENELWNKIRIDPTSLPTGDLRIIPSLEFMRLKHIEIKAYKATASLQKENINSNYTLTYPELNRTLKIQFQSDFPYSIESWSETFTSGYGENSKELKTTAKKINQIKSPYWQQNKRKDTILRRDLGL